MKNFLEVTLPQYWKSLIALVPVILFVGTEVVQAIQNASVDGLETKDAITIVIAAVTAYFVYRKTNAPQPITE